MSSILHRRKRVSDNIKKLEKVNEENDVKPDSDNCDRCGDSGSDSQEDLSESGVSPYGLQA